jgi:hypothetical protein
LCLSQIEVYRASSLAIWQGLARGLWQAWIDPDGLKPCCPCPGSKPFQASRSFAVMTSAPLSMSASVSLSSASASADSLLRRKRRTCPARSELAVEQFGAAHGNTAAVLSDGLITGIF